MVLVRRPGALLPRVALVTRRPVAAGEELTYAYGQPYDGGYDGGYDTVEASAGAARPGPVARGAASHDEGGRSLGAPMAMDAIAIASERDPISRPHGGGGASRRLVRCACGTAACRGFMPSEDV
jgi:hypothetical protein